MNVGELIDIWRSDVGDTVHPYLWPITNAVEFADDAQNEACRRARLLRDSTTVDICEIALEVGTAVYALDPRVIRVDRARLEGETVPLRFCLMRNADSMCPGWDTWDNSTPQFIIPDHSSRSLYLAAPPDATGTLLLNVVRLPLATLNSTDDDLEIPLHHQRSLRHWMTYRALLQHDSETFDKKAAETALSLFEQEFGRAQPAYDEQWIQDHYVGNGYGHY